MSMQAGFSIIALACLAGAAYGQQTQPGQPDPTTTPTQPMPVQPLPSQASPATPDQANPATYPAPADAGNSDPSSASSPHQRDLTSHAGTETATPSNQNAANRSATSPHQRNALRTASVAQPASGMDVQTRTGQPLGTIVNIVNDSTGRPAYVVVADTNGNETAVPYGPARQMLQGNAIVMDAQRLQNAPKVPESQLQNSASTDWQGKADSYWRGQEKNH